jgi:hypothetical protein
MATETLQKQTPEALHSLKLNWAADACWDIEDTEGFEAHHDELLAYSEEMKATWRAEQQDVLEKRAVALGCPGNLRLANYVVALERRLEKFVERLESVEASQRRP